MNIFITADLHLGHDAIRRHCGRPFESLAAMDEALISNWNGLVSRRDLVYVVGDLAWRNHSKYLARLEGKKILIRGNHDKMPESALRNFTEVHDLLVRRIDGRQIVFCHYRLTTWPGSNRDSWHLHGHSHGTLEESNDSPCCDVGVDVWEYAPIPWEAIAIKLEPRKKVLSDDTSWIDLNIENNRRENRGIRDILIDGRRGPRRRKLVPQTHS